MRELSTRCLAQALTRVSLACLLVGIISVENLAPALAEPVEPLSTAGISAKNVVKIGLHRFHLNDNSRDLKGPATPPGAQTDVRDTSSLALSYRRYLTDHFSIELIGGIPPKFDFSGKGSIESLGKVGSATALNPAVLLNVHLVDRTMPVRPYLGAGLTYTWFVNEKASETLQSALGGPTHVQLEDFLAPCVTAGLDIDITPNVTFSTAGIFAWADTRATITTGGIDRTIDVTLDPIVFFAGLSYDF